MRRCLTLAAAKHLITAAASETTQHTPSPRGGNHGGEAHSKTAVVFYAYRAARSICSPDCLLSGWPPRWRARRYARTQPPRCTQDPTCCGDSDSVLSDVTAANGRHPRGAAGAETVCGRSRPRKGAHPARAAMYSACSEYYRSSFGRAHMRSGDMMVTTPLAVAMPPCARQFRWQALRGAIDCRLGCTTSCISIYLRPLHCDPADG